MRRTILTLAAAAAVLAAAAPAYATQYDNCQVISRANMLKCVIEISQRGF